jgi:sodium/bile acid cotransporter 7
MHGAKLSRDAIMGCMSHWRLHLVVFLSTFALFPVLGICLKVFQPSLLSTPVYLGFLYLCALPATVQSAIAFTSVAGGNVAAAICSASASSILGVFLSPVLVSLLMQTQQGAGGHNTLHAIGSIILQLMVPFILGHLSRPLIGAWVSRHKKLINITDRSSILLVVYTAFSEAVVGGIWHQITGWSLVSILVYSLLLLAIVLVINTWMARWLGFSTADEITIVFCGSKKSLANGIPMANVLFPAAAVGTMVLPLMIFHQVQLMVCAVLAQRYARKQAQLVKTIPADPS